MILAECYIISDIEPDMYDMTLDIERQCDSQYRLRHHHTKCWFDVEVMNPRYRRPCYWCSISKIREFRHRRMRPSISNTFDINIRYRRFKTLISNEHTILSSISSSISKVTFDIEGPTLDVGVARIQMYLVNLCMYVHVLPDNIRPKCLSMKCRNVHVSACICMHVSVCVCILRT